ncbi:MAG: phosphoribosyltransferase [Patescibacteria group bacterium]
MLIPRKLISDNMNPMEWGEFGKAMDTLIRKLEKYMKDTGVKFNLIAPILRSGGIPGAMVAIHFNIVTMLPIQLKRLPGSMEPVEVIVTKLNWGVPKDPVVLICENNTGHGTTARKAIRIMRQKYPEARLFYATVTKAYGGPDALDGVEEYFYGALTDELFVASAEDIRKKHIRPNAVLFPWEILEEEVNETNKLNGVG